MRRGTAIIGSIVLAIGACTTADPVSAPSTSPATSTPTGGPAAACAGMLVSIEGRRLSCRNTTGRTVLREQMSQRGLDGFALSSHGALAAILGSPYDDGDVAGEIWTSTPQEPHRFTRLVRVTEPDRYPMNVAWSADGESLYVATATFDGEEAIEHAVHALTRAGELEQLARFDGACCYEYPAFGSVAAGLLHTYIGIGDGLGHYHSLRQIDLGNGRVRDLDVDIGQSPDGTDEGPPGPVFAGDGSSFVVLTDAGRGLERVELPGLSRQGLHAVSGRRRIVRPSPSPDGRLVLLQVIEATDSYPDLPPPRVLLADATTGEVGRVRGLDRGWWRFTWAPDGDVVYASRTDRTAAGLWNRVGDTFTAWEDPPDDVLGWLPA